jgi:hypothetical protein
MKLQYQAFALYLLLFLLTACKGDIADEAATFTSAVQPEAVEATVASPLQPEAVVATATPPPQPQAGRATVIGRVISRSTGVPIVDVAVRLAEVHRQGDGGAFVLEDAFSPGNTTDEYGRFIIEDVAAKEYVIVVGNVSTLYEIIAGPSGKARVWDIPTDQIFDTGDLRVNLEP